MSESSSAKNLGRITDEVLRELYDNVNLKFKKIVPIIKKMNKRKNFKIFSHEFKEHLTDLGAWAGFGLRINARYVLPTVFFLQNQWEDLSDDEQIDWRTLMSIIECRVALSSLEGVNVRVPEDLLLMVAHVARARDLIKNAEHKGHKRAPINEIFNQLKIIRLLIVRAFYNSTGIAGSILSIRRGLY